MKTHQELPIVVNKRKPTSLRKFNQEISLCLLLVFIQFICGCSFYKVTSLETIAPVSDHIKKNSKYFIVHKDNIAWRLNNISLNEEKKEITGILEPLPENHKHYLTTKPSSPNRIKAPKPDPKTALARSHEGDPLDEVHFYITAYIEGPGSFITIPFSSIERIEKYDHGKKANAGSDALAGLGVVTGILLVFGGIAAADVNGWYFTLLASP